jgi:hypothetical protein
VSLFLDWAPGVILTMTTLVMIQNGADGWPIALTAWSAGGCLGMAFVRVLRR